MITVSLIDGSYKYFIYFRENADYLREITEHRDASREQETISSKLTTGFSFILTSYFFF